MALTGSSKFEGFNAKDTGLVLSLANINYFKMTFEEPFDQTNIRLLLIDLIITVKT